MKKKHVFFSGLLAALLIVPPTTQAITIDGGPAWPGSADTSGVTGSGNMGTDSDDSWTYPNIGNSSVANLWFGLWNLDYGPHGYSANGSDISGSEVFQWLADTGTSIEYRGQTTTLHVSGGSTTWTTRLLLTAVSGATVISDSTTQALVGGAHSLFHITGSSFEVHREIQVLYQGSWYDANPFLSTWCGSNQCQQTGTGTSLATGFYWEDLAQVPVPGTLTLIGLGLIGIGYGSRRKAS